MRSASCISRGRFTCVVTLPNVLLAAVLACVFGGPNWTRLNRLNASTRARQVHAIRYHGGNRKSGGGRTSNDAGNGTRHEYVAKVRRARRRGKPERVLQMTLFERPNEKPAGMYQNRSRKGEKPNRSTTTRYEQW
jgi:hypothetical protein